MINITWLEGCPQLPLWICVLWYHLRIMVYALKQSYVSLLVILSLSSDHARYFYTLTHTQGLISYSIVTSPNYLEGR